MRLIAWTSSSGLLALLSLVACSATSGAPDSTSSRGSALEFGSEPAGVPRGPSLFEVWQGQAPGQIVDAYVYLGGAPAAETIPPGVDIRTDVRARGAFRARAELLAAQHAAMRPRLEAFGATIVADLRKVANLIQVRVPAGKLQRISALAEVDRIEPVPTFSRMTKSGVPAMGAPAVWERAVPVDGDGVRVGIVDTGIDYIHADFGGSGLQADYDANDSSVVEAGTFPTVRVVGGTDFAGDAYNGSNTPVPDADPLDCVRAASGGISGGHGTHVAGISGGNGVLTDGSAYLGPYNASLDPDQFEIYPGAAPKAQLFALRVFGCDGGTNVTAGAYEYAIDPDGDNDPSDRLDVVNASLGSDFGFGFDSQATMIRNLTSAGGLFVAAAGNAGSSFFITGNPAGYPEALSVASTSENALPELQITSPTSVAGSYPAVDGSFTAALPTDVALSADLVQTNPGDACVDLSNGAAIAGKIALIDRGDCTFVSKIQRAEAAGAIAVVMVQNNQSEPPFPMGGDTNVGIPGVMISRSTGSLLLSAGGTLSGGLLAVEGQSQLSPFSSRGPSAAGVGFKPEVAGPGSNIRSAGVGTGTRGVNLSGTSMASPMVAGAAALVRQAHPSWGPLEVKQALINTAAPTTKNGMTAPVSHVGSGRVRVDRAVATQVVAGAEPSAGSGVSFGVIAVTETTTETRTVRLSNKGSAEETFDAAAALTYPVAGVSVAVTPGSVTVPAGGTADVELSLTFDPSQLTDPVPDPTTPVTVLLNASDEHERHFVVEGAGLVTFTATGTNPVDLVVPFNSSLRTGGDRELAAGATCVPSGSSVELVVTGMSPVSAPVVGVFELGQTVSDPLFPPEPASNLEAVGAATDLGAKPFAEAFAYIAVAVKGEWTTPAPNSFQTFQQGFPGRYIVQIDVDGDGSEDNTLGAYAVDDLHRARTISNNGIGTPNFLNRFPREVLDTQPYFNSVVMFPVLLSDLGLSEGNAKFSYRVISVGSSLQVADDSSWVEFDPESPKVSAAAYGHEGSPLFGNNTPIQVDVADVAEGADAPQALVLHFDNVLDSRFQILDLPVPGANSSNLAVSVGELPESVVADTELSVTVTVANTGDTSRGGVSLAASLSGATIESATPSQGSCQTSPSLDCALGDIAGASEATIELTLRADSGSSRVTLESTVSGDQVECDSATDDTVQSEVTVRSGGPGAGGASGAGGSAGAVANNPDEEFIVSGGGCGCRIDGSDPGDSRPLWLGIGLLGWVLGRRRFTRAAASRL